MFSSMTDAEQRGCVGVGDLDVATAARRARPTNAPRTSSTSTRNPSALQTVDGPLPSRCNSVALAVDLQSHVTPLDVDLRDALAPLSQSVGRPLSITPVLAGGTRAFERTQIAPGSAPCPCRVGDGCTTWLNSICRRRGSSSPYSRSSR